jgi:hypothetical protein
VQTAGLNGAWQRPAQSAVGVRNFGPNFDLFGAPTAGSTDFCVHIRLTWLSLDEFNGGVPGTGSIRTDVRVFWLRDGATRVANDCASGAAGVVSAVGTDANDSYFFVHHTGAVAQRP